MKSPRTLLTVLATFASGVLTAQTAPVSAAPGETIVLSPFVVTTETQKGYLANETLAGMRIKTDLRDVGAAINVMTEAFLNEVGAVDMNQALKYAPNMQFADFAASGGNGQWFSAPYLSRGVVGSTVMTDFFLTGSVPIDRYNTDNLTFLRGPNSILFGIGSPSGIVGASSKRASLGQDSRSVRFMADTFDSARTELDVSHVLLRNKLAGRFAAVASDQHNDQKPSLNRRKAVYGTVTYKPFSRTTITVNGESGRYDRYFQMYSLTSDAYTPWVLAGRPTVNFVTGKGMVNNSTTKGQFSTSIGSGIANISTASYLVYIEGANLPIMDWRNMARGAYWSQTRQAGAAGSGLMLTVDRGQMDSIPFTRDNTIVDLRANPWGGYNRNDLHYKNRSVFVEQNLWRDLDLELAWNGYKQGYLFNNTLGKNFDNRIAVDPNEVLPNGAPNPNVGKPYIEQSPGGDQGIRRFRAERDIAAKRATLSYKLDLDRHKIFKRVGLGNYRFAGLFQDHASDEKVVVSNFVNVTPLPGTPTNIPLSQNQNRLARRYYLQPGQSQYLGYNYVQDFSQASVPGATVSGPIKFEERNATESPRNIQQSTESLVGAVQGSWWQASEGYFHLTGLFGRRQDRQRDRAQTFVRQPNGEFAGPISNFNKLDEFGTWAPMTKYQAHTKSYNVVFRPISQLRLFDNFSDIFATAAASNFVDVFGKALRPAIGKTKDYGVRLDVWSGRVYLSATKYETGIVDTSIDNTGPVRQPINDIYYAMSRPDLVLDRPFSYRNDISRGYEFELTTTVTQEWRARVTFGTQKTVPSAAFDDWVVYFADNRSRWQQAIALPLQNPVIGYTTVADAITRADQTLRDARAANGVQPADQRTRNATFNTNYTFSKGRLKNVRMGGGFQWGSRNVIGYARNNVGNLDTSKPFSGPKRFSTDASIGYWRKVYRDKVTWDVQINVYNVLGEDPLLARTAVDDGTGNPLVTRRYTQTRSYLQLTNSFRF